MVKSTRKRFGIIGKSLTVKLHNMKFAPIVSMTPIDTAMSDPNKSIWVKRLLSKNLKTRAYEKSTKANMPHHLGENSSSVTQWV